MNTRECEMGRWGYRQGCALRSVWVAVNAPCCEASPGRIRPRREVVHVGGWVFTLRAESRMTLNYIPFILKIHRWPSVGGRRQEVCGEIDVREWEMREYKRGCACERVCGCRVWEEGGWAS